MQNATSNAQEYAAPKLVVYGDVVELTAAGSTTPSEPVSGTGSVNQKR